MHNQVVHWKIRPAASFPVTTAVVQIKNMKNKGALDSISELGKKEIIELVCLPIGGLASFFIYLKFKTMEWGQA